MIQPKIRFNGFKDEWVEGRLKDILKLRNIVPTSTQKKLPVLTSSRQGLMNQSDYYKDRLVSSKDLSKYHIVSENAITYRQMSDDNVFVFNQNKLGYAGLVSPAYPVMIYNSNVISEYLMTYLNNSVQMKQEIYLSVEGTTRTSLPFAKLSKFKIQLPTLPEQQKIGALFSKYDAIIALREQKLAELNALKKGMLQQMFDDGSATSHKPQVRFSGFNDVWVEKKLGDLASSFEYGLNASAVEFDGVHKYIRITDIDSESRSLKEDTLTSPNISYDGMDKYLVKEGDILFARTGASVGKAYKYNKSDGIAYYAGFLIRMRLKPNFDSDFVFQNVFTNKYAKFIEINSQRSGQPGVNSKEYSLFKIQIPTLPEQQKIGQLFEKLDAEIAAEQAKIDWLKEQKKGLLERVL